MEALTSGCIPVIWDKNQFSAFNGLISRDHPNDPQSHIKLANKLNSMLIKDDEREEAVKQLMVSKSIIDLDRSSQIYINSFNGINIAGDLLKEKFKQHVKEQQANQFNLPSNVDLSKYIDSDSESESDTDAEYEPDSEDESKEETKTESKEETKTESKEETKTESTNN
jgi:hypothetical protein